MSSARRSAERRRLAEEGYQAHAAGHGRNRCPYRHGTSDKRDWQSGWDQAEDEARSRARDQAIGSKYALAERAREATSVEELAAILAEVIEALPDDHFDGG